MTATRNNVVGCSSLQSAGLLCQRMPHPEENKMGGHLNDDVVVTDSAFVASFDNLVDVLPNILGFLPPKDIMRQRRVCRKCSEAAKKTIVPLTDFRLNSVEKYNAMVVMTRALPNLQQLTIICLEPELDVFDPINGLGRRHKYNDGEDPDEWRAAIVWDHETTQHDIEIVSNFRKLRDLTIFRSAPLNGRYPVLFDFPLLQKLKITYDGLKWDLEMLTGFPLLKKLNISYNSKLTGNISNLRVLKDTLELVDIYGCRNVQGNFMDLADFSHLKALNLFDTAVTGDVRDIVDNDFSLLVYLRLPRTVYGGWGCELQRISDAHDLMKTLYLFNRQRSGISMSLFKDWYGKLSENSPDWYESLDVDFSPPFCIRFVEARSRIGYRWTALGGRTRACEVNWLNTEPERESNEYDEYIKRLRQIETPVDFYKGFHQPPTEEEYNGLYEDEEW